MFRAKSVGISLKLWIEGGPEMAYHGGGDVSVYGIGLDAMYNIYRPGM